MKHPEKHRRKEPFLRLPAILSHVQRRQVAMRLPPLAIGLAVKKRMVAVFFRASHMILKAQLSADAIEVSNTDMDAKLFL